MHSRLHVHYVVIMKSQQLPGQIRVAGTRCRAGRAERAPELLPKTAQAITRSSGRKPARLSWTRRRSATCHRQRESRIPGKGGQGGQHCNRAQVTARRLVAMTIQYRTAHLAAIYEPPLVLDLLRVRRQRQSPTSGDTGNRREVTAACYDAEGLGTSPRSQART